MKRQASIENFCAKKISLNKPNETIGSAEDGCASSDISGLIKTSTSTVDCEHRHSIADDQGDVTAGCSGEGSVGIRMSSRPKEKMAASFRKLFHSSDKVADGETGSGGQKTSGSPAHRLLSRHRDILTPSEAEVLPQGASRGPVGLFKKKSEPEQPDNVVRTRRLMKELKEIQRNEIKDDPVFTVNLVNDDLFDWHVRLHRIDSESALAADMREQGVPHILLHLTFPDNFPFAPPFMRVISPQIERGYVMKGGAICMELLTPQGWASAYTVEAIIMQFAATVVKGKGRIAKKTESSSKDFSRRSAEKSFQHLVKSHEKKGWFTPPLADG